MRDFPVANQPSLKESINLIQDRCTIWDSILFDNIISSDDIYELISSLPRSIHYYIFNGILGNAGKVRNISDKNNGHVEFGLPVKGFSDSANYTRSKFIGTSPEYINTRLNETIKLLSRDASDPIENAAIFYQQFVGIHPFYDGNGRIGRIMVDVYLYSQKYFMKWGDLRKTTRWLRQLNYCHRKMQSTQKSSYSFALRWWIHYFKKFTESLDKHEEPDILSNHR